MLVMQCCQKYLVKTTWIPVCDDYDRKSNVYTAMSSETNNWINNENVFYFDKN